MPKRGADDAVVDETEAHQKRQKKDEREGQAVDDDGQPYWELTRTRRVTLSEFRGKSMINIREYYEKDGKLLPGKKGISLTIEQFATVIDVLPQIEDNLRDLGISVPRPQYDRDPDTPNSDHKDGSDGQGQGCEVGTSKVNSKSRANHEATDDEDDGAEE